MSRATRTPVQGTDPRSADRYYLVLALALIAIAATFLLVWYVPAHGGVDENGYLVAGRQIALTGRPALTPVHYNASPVPTCVGDMWIGQNLGTPQERYLPIYPPLVPLLIAGALHLGGQSMGVDLAYLLNPMGYCIGLLGVYLLARRLVGPSPAIAALAVAITAVPILRMFTFPGSHGVSFAATSMAAYCLVRWLDDRTWRHAIGAGVLCALAAAARSGEISLVAALLVAAALRCWQSRRDLQQALAMLGGWGVVLALFILLQHGWSGQWSLYSATSGTRSFAISYLVEHLPIMTEHLFLRGIGLMFPLGVVGLVMLVRRNHAMGLAMAAWVSVNLLLYSAYFWAPRSSFNIYCRYFLPSFAPLCACGVASLVWLMKSATDRTRKLKLRLALWCAVLISAVIAVFNFVPFFSLDTMSRMNIQDRAQWLGERVPPDAVIFCDELDVMYHLQFASGYTLYDSRMFRREDIEPLVQFVPGEPSRMDAERRRYLNEVLLSRSPEQLTDLRDDLIAAYRKAGRRVFVFSGPKHAWMPLDSLESRGLQAMPVAQGKDPWPPMPTIPDRWSLEEIVAK
jgi:hypothetical protein